MTPQPHLSMTPVLSQPLHEIDRVYFVHCDDGQGGFARGGAVDRIELRKGSLAVDGVPILQPRFHGNAVSWAQRTKDHYSAGCLYISGNGLECRGTITSGPSPAEAKAAALVAVAIEPTTYRTRITSRRYPVGTNPASVPADAWQDGLEMTLGFRHEAGHALPRLIVTINGVDIPDRVILDVDTHGRLHIEVILEDEASVYCLFDPSLYLRGRFHFSTFGERFEGTLTSTCFDLSGEGAYLWKGEAIASPRESARAIEQRAIAPGDLLELEALDVRELMTLIPSSQVGTTTNAMLVENMKWAMGQTEDGKQLLQTFFQQTPPVLAPEQENLARQDLAWFQNDFSVGYLGWGLQSLTGPNAPTTRLDAHQEIRLNNWLERIVPVSIPFTRQMIGLYTDAYLKSQPRLRAYIADGGPKWAQALNATITEPAQLSLVVGNVTAAKDMSIANNFATLLRTLDPDSDLASKYAETVLTRVLLQQTWGTVAKDRDALMEWLPNILEEFVNRFGTRGGAAAEGDHEKKAIADDLEKAAEFFGDFTELANQFALVLIAAKGSSIAGQTESAEKAFKTKFPKFATAAKALLFVAWAAGVVSVVVAFLGWNTITSEDKAHAITAAVGLVNVAAEQIVGILKNRMTLRDWNAVNRFAGEPGAINATRSILQQRSQSFPEVGARETSPMLDARTRTVNPSRNWTKIFSNATKVIGVIGVAVSAAFTIISAIKLIKEGTAGKSPGEAVLDVLIFVANFFSTVAMVLNLIAANVVFAIAASALAIIGLILSIIAIFIPRPESEKPTNKFMAEKAIPFVNRIPIALPPPSPRLLPAGAA